MYNQLMNAHKMYSMHHLQFLVTWEAYFHQLVSLFYMMYTIANHPFKVPPPPELLDLKEVIAATVTERGNEQPQMEQQQPSSSSTPMEVPEEVEEDVNTPWGNMFEVANLPASPFHLSGRFVLPAQPETSSPLLCTIAGPSQ